MKLSIRRDKTKTACPAMHAKKPIYLLHPVHVEMGVSRRGAGSDCTAVF